MGRRGREPADIAVGQRVRLYRVAKGMTQMQLAELMEFSGAQIQKYESGASKMSVGMAIRFARHLGISFMDLMHGLDDAEVVNSDLGTYKFLADTRVLHVAEGFSTIKSKAVSDAIYKLVRGLAEGSEE